MREAPEISVVVPVYNGATTIGPCLDSLLALQPLPASREIIVVDNNSTDATPHVLARYDEAITVVREAVRGPAAARNRGIDSARGAIIAFTDADCTVEPQWLDELVRPLEDPTVGVVGGRILARRGANRIERFGDTIHDHRMAIEVFAPPYAITMNWASRRQVLIEAGLFDEAFIRCEDVDLSQRIVQRNYRIVYAHDAVVRHRNERSLAGLMREGYQHGVWSVRHNKVSREFASAAGHRRFDLKTYRRIMINLWKACFSRQKLHALCQALFDIGKKAGKVVGSVRFGYVDL